MHEGQVHVGHLGHEAGALEERLRGQREWQGRPGIPEGPESSWEPHPSLLEPHPSLLEPHSSPGAPFQPLLGSHPGPFGVTSQPFWSLIPPPFGAKFQPFWSHIPPFLDPFSSPFVVTFQPLDPHSSPSRSIFQPFWIPIPPLDPYPTSPNPGKGSPGRCPCGWDPAP